MTSYDPLDPHQVLTASIADAHRIAGQVPGHGQDLLRRVLTQASTAAELGRQAPQLMRHVDQQPIPAGQLELLVELLRRLPKQVYVAAGLMTTPPSPADWAEVNALVDRADELLAAAQAEAETTPRPAAFG